MVPPFVPHHHHRSPSPSGPSVLEAPPTTQWPAPSAPEGRGPVCAASLPFPLPAAPVRVGRRLAAEPPLSRGPGEPSQLCSPISFPRRSPFAAAAPAGNMSEPTAAGRGLTAAAQAGYQPRAPASCAICILGGLGAGNALLKGAVG